MRHRQASRLAGAALIGILASLPFPAAATETAAIYKAWYAGLPAGRIRLALEDEAGRYRDEIAIRSEGLPWLATRFRGTAVSHGEVAAGRPAPARYGADYDLRKTRGKRLRMVFTARAGRLVADRGPQDTGKQRLLAERYRSNVYDPLSALTAIRDKLRSGTRGTFRVPVYDGARRFDVIIRVLPGRAGDKVLHLELSLAPIAGFKGESSENGDPNDAPRRVALTISDDWRLMPLTMRVSVYYLPLIVQLSRWCDDAQQCRL